MYEWSLVVKSDAVSEICDSNRVRPVKKNNNNKDSTENATEKQATVKRFQFDLYVNLEGQQTLISSWGQK